VLTSQGCQSFVHVLLLATLSLQVRVVASHRQPWRSCRTAVTLSEHWLYLLPSLLDKVRRAGHFTVSCYYVYCTKARAVPQHTYGGAGGRGLIAPTHSKPRH
jgi:hypothetical protein